MIIHMGGGADALGETIGGMFDIPEQDIEGQMADSLTIGDSGTTSTPAEEPWDPFSGF